MHNSVFIDSDSSFHTYFHIAITKCKFDSPSKAALCPLSLGRDWTGDHCLIQPLFYARLAGRGPRSNIVVGFNRKLAF